MASIYRATDERLQRVVCVKLLRLVLEAGSTSGSSVYQATYAHFLQEALALSRLHHPNTLKIFDFGYLEDSGRPFQISEFLDAGNLEQHVKREGPVLPTTILSILEPIGGAMTEAHELSIIHRDIKPSNILFGRINQMLIPKLADFGIAHSNPVRKRTSAGDDEDPVSVVTLFSPRWAAPEQLAGASSGPVDRRLFIRSRDRVHARRTADVRRQGSPRDVSGARHRRQARDAAVGRDGDRTTAAPAAPSCARGAHRRAHADGVALRRRDARSTRDDGRLSRARSQAPHAEREHRDALHSPRHQAARQRCPRGRASASRRDPDEDGSERQGHRGR